MSDRKRYTDEQRKCMHHDGFNIRISKNEEDIKSMKKMNFAMFTMHVASLCTLITLLVVQLMKPVEKVSCTSGKEMTLLGYIFEKLT